jgi:hypothetical protein
MLAKNFIKALFYIDYAVVFFVGSGSGWLVARGVSC